VADRKIYEAERSAAKEGVRSQTPHGLRFDEFQFFLPRPAFYLGFALERHASRFIFLGIEHFLGAVRAGVARAYAFPIFMFGKASRNVCGDPGVNTFIRALQKIDEVRHEIKLPFPCYNTYMNITKLGHCCLVLEIEEGGTKIKILTDPGTFTTEPVKTVMGVNVILITHEHGDHFHIESIEEVLKNNPTATVVSNSAVAKLLAEKNIPCTVVGDAQSATVGAANGAPGAVGVLIEGFGKDHAPIYGTMGLVENTGYFVANKFYFPGDSFYNPKKPIDVLALPTAGPWMKISEAIDFTKLIKPRIAFPVHDGMIVPGFGGFVATMLQNFLKPDGVEFASLGAGESREF
jgi:L-ascorbate metabolism protein UlaG (beta-lactamase superfamily)